MSEATKIDYSASLLSKQKNEHKSNTKKLC